MQTLSIVSAGQSRKVFRLALDFVLPFEKRCAALVQRIINQDESVHIIVEAGTERSFRPQVFGVFTYNARGRLVFSCLPYQSEEVEIALENFFASRPVFCISGQKEYADFLEKIVGRICRNRQTEIHDYFFMEFDKSMLNGRSEKFQDRKDAKIIRCNANHIEALMPLQLEYTRVEVLPAWRDVNPAAERLGLEKNFKNQFYFAVVKEGRIVSKLNTNAITTNYMQIGGVYTVKEFRGQGFASALVEHLAREGMNLKKQAILFVKELNSSAIKAYVNAGFKIAGKYKIVYYKE